MTDDARAETITVPRPHVPHGPQGVTEGQADADYLRKAARDLSEHYKPFGSNLRATVVQLLNDAADALAAGRAEATTATTEDAAEALHGDACPEDPDSGETCGCDHDYYRRQANVLAAHGLLATARTRAGEEHL